MASQAQLEDVMNTFILAMGTAVSRQSHRAHASYNLEILYG